MSGLKVKTIHKPDRLMNYWMREKFVISNIIFFGLIFNISMILGPIIQGKLIDSLVRGDRLLSIVKLVSVFILTIALIQIFRYIKRFYIRRFANSTSASMRLMIYNHIMHMDTSSLRQEKTGDLMTKAISDVDLCVEGMRKFSTEVFDTGVLMLSYLVTMIVYDVKVTFLSVLFIPIAMFLAEKLKGIIYKYTIAYRKKSSEVTGLTYDFIDNAMLYRVNGVEGVNLGKYRETLEDLQKKAVKANILEDSMQPIYNIIAMIGILIVIYLGGSKVIDQSWTVGTFSAYITIFIAMAAKASKASKLFNSVQKSKISWLRIKPYLTEYQQKDTSLNINQGRTTISIRDLSFGYQSGAENVIENLNFDAVQGELIGVTGPVACGKTTLGLALTGLYPYLGSILIDGKELRDYTEFERSQMISYHGHKSELISDTIYQNITLGKDQDISEVLRDVCFDEDLKTMSDSINTLVGNGGVRLSGGQQARIALARALLNKNKIIILDDPFSAVDMKTELAIIRNMKEHYRNSIFIIMSHRLAIFSRVDRVILMKDDKTTEYGTHEELMSTSSFYSTIYQLQSVEESDN